MRTDGGSSEAERPASQPGDGGPNPTPPLKLFRADLVSRREIAAFVERHHYSQSLNGVNSKFCFDFRDTEGKLVGAMILGRPAARDAGKYGDKVIEIRRLVCADDTPRNAESRFVGYVLRWLRKNTEYDAVLAYADSEHGHKGTVYAASNFRKVAVIPGAPVILWNGKRYHDRSLRKVEGRLKPFSRRLRVAICRGEARLRRTKGKTVWLYRWEPPARHLADWGRERKDIVSGKRLDAKGEAARRLYRRMAATGKDYNSGRRAQTEALRNYVAPVWAALEAGIPVNGCKDKLSWARWFNPKSKHPERYLYKLMHDPRLNSVQPKKVAVIAPGMDAVIDGIRYEVTKEWKVERHMEKDKTVTVTLRGLWTVIRPLRKRETCPECGYTLDVNNGKFEKHTHMPGPRYRQTCKMSEQRLVIDERGKIVNTAKADAAAAAD